MTLFTWTCQECNSHSYTFTKERSPDGSFKDSSRHQCDNCKSSYLADGRKTYGSREFFNSSGRYFFADILEVHSDPYYVKAIKSDNTEFWAMPALGHMKEVSRSEIVRSTISYKIANGIVEFNEEELMDSFYKYMVNIANSQKAISQ